VNTRKEPHITISVPIAFIDRLAILGHTLTELAGELRIQAGINSTTLKDDGATQVWFWGSEWQRGEAQVTRELLEGCFRDFASIDTCIEELQSQI
jgi:hypothetical protein